MSIKGIANLAELMADRPSTGTQDIPLSRIDPDPHQPRTNFDELRLDALAASVTAQGIVEPLIVSPIRRPLDVISWWPGSGAGEPRAWPD